MTTLQEYLNQKYPTKKDKERVSKINVKEIREERKAQGFTDPLEGGDLELKEYVGLEELDVSVETHVKKTKIE